MTFPAHLPLNPSVRSSCSQYALQFSVQYAESFGAMALQLFIQSEKQSAAASDFSGDATSDGAAPIKPKAARRFTFAEHMESDKLVFKTATSVTSE